MCGRPDGCSWLRGDLNASFGEAFIPILAVDGVQGPKPVRRRVGAYRLHRLERWQYPLWEPPVLAEGLLQGPLGEARLLPDDFLALAAGGQ